MSSPSVTGAGSIPLVWHPACTSAIAAAAATRNFLASIRVPPLALHPTSLESKNHGYPIRSQGAFRHRRTRRALPPHGERPPADGAHLSTERLGALPRPPRPPRRRLEQQG